MTSVAILGITGRMGHALLAAIDETPGIALGGATASADSRWLGKDAGEAGGGGAKRNVIVEGDPAAALRDVNVAIDFTLPEATAANIAACVAAKCPVVIGTTGHSESVKAQIEAAARSIPILMSPNMSIGVNVLCRLAELATRILGEDFDAEVAEIHHRDKRDAPSGTALRIGESVAKARGVNLTDVAALDRKGRRGKGQIGFSVSRGGDVVGEHTLTLLGNGESLALTHKATNRLTFARGALHAACWLAGRKPGLYSMSDVLDVDTAGQVP